MQRKKQSQIHDNDYPSSEASDFEGFHERVVGRDFSSDEEDVQVDQEVLGIHSSDSDQDSQDDESDENSLVSEEELLENFMKFNKNATGKKENLTMTMMEAKGRMLMKMVRLMGLCAQRASNTLSLSN